MHAYQKIAGGYHWKLLRINLTVGEITVEDLSEKLLMNFIGGRGLGTKLLYDELDPGTNPLSAENKLYFVTGPLNGTGFASSGNFSVVSKSPLTHTVSAANSCGYFGNQLKSTGFDVLVIEGEAAAPSYIFIENQKVEIRSATHIWGMDIPRSTDYLIQETATKAAVSCIGPAGEKQMLISSIINDKMHSINRGGLGAVMGAKKLKAVVVTGSTKTAVAHENDMQKINSVFMQFLNEMPLTKNILKEYGTPGIMRNINKLGALGVRNFQNGVFNDIDSISAETIKELYFTDKAPCDDCSTACKYLTETPGRKGVGPEFDAVASFGSMCQINDLEKIIHANYKCYEFGLDPISAGNTMACAMELSERGFLDQEARQLIRKAIGRELKFGDAEAMLIFSEQMGKGKGFGKYLGLGSKRLAEKYGCPEAAMHVKGLELPPYDPRGLRSLGVVYATSSKGGCCHSAFTVAPEALETPFAVNRFQTNGKNQIIKFYQDNSAIVDSMALCFFSSLVVTPDLLAQCLSAVTGLKIDVDTFLKTGERIWNLERLFNNREGFSAPDDILPQRFLCDNLKAGKSKNNHIELDNQLQMYYKIRSWNSDGFPEKEKLQALDLLHEDN